MIAGSLELPYLCLLEH